MLWRYEFFKICDIDEAVTDDNCMPEGLHPPWTLTIRRRPVEGGDNGSAQVVKARYAWMSCALVMLVLRPVGLGRGCQA